MWPKVHWWKVIFVVALYAAAFLWLRDAKANETIDREMYCNIFQGKLDAFGASLRDGISPERIEKVINETSLSPEEAKMYKTMVTLLLADDNYKDALGVKELGEQVTQECIKGVQQ